MEDIGRWVTLGAIIGVSGTNGSVHYGSWRYLADVLKCRTGEGLPNEGEVFKVLANLPGVLMSDSPVSWPHGRGKRPECDGVVWEGFEVVSGRCSDPLDVWCRKSSDVFITFKNWSKYQYDSSHGVRGEKTLPKKRREEKRRETTGPDLFGQSKEVQKGEEKAYVMRDPGQQVVGAYKILTGVDLENREWDRMYYSRFKKNAEELLKFFHGSVEACCECMEQVKKWADIRKLDWNFNTVIKRAADVKSGRLWKNG